MNQLHVTKKSASQLLIMLLFTSLLSACGGSDEEQPPLLRPVKTIVINDQSESSLKAYTGVSRSTQESILSFKVAGTVKTIPVKVGDSIGAGTVIATLDASAYELARQQAQATVAQSSAAARNARTVYDRTKSLYANNNVSLGELDNARANSESANAQLQAANKALELAELNLSYTQLSIDVDCVVDSILVSENENASTSTQVAQVNCSDQLEIELAVPESSIGDFSRGKEAVIEFDVMSDQYFKGEVAEVGLDAGGKGSTFPVTVSINEYVDAMRPGLAASVSFVVDNGDSGLHVLPLSAVVKNSQGNIVYLVEPTEGGNDKEFERHGIVAAKPVTLGELRSNGIEVLDGLQAHDRVVIAGTSFIREDLRVLY